MTTQKILVVDDEPFILRSLSFVLRKGDMDVLEARNGEEALELIRAHKPVLVFLDVMMPKMNGYDVVREVRADS
ncbi:MAG: response regulator, partial [Planctomycetota bacterium]|nr:response regulator [Planctomycetota bacterium]